MKIIVLAVVVFSWFGAVALADTPSESFARLEALIKKDLQDHQSDNSPEKIWRARNNQASSYMLAQLRGILARQDYEQAEDIMNHNVFQLLTTDEEQREATNLSSLLRKEREAKLNTRISEVDGTLKRASDLVRSAKDPKELDPILADLGRVHDQIDDRVPEQLRAALKRTQPSLQFVRRWQDYLAASKAGNSKAAEMALRSVLDQEGSNLIARSEIIVRLEKLKTPEGNDKPIELPSQQIDDVLAGVKTPDGIATAIAQLQSLQRPGGSRSYSYSNASPLGATIDALVVLDRIYQEHRAGLPFKLDPAVLHFPPAASNKVAGVEAKVLLVVLPRFLKASSDLNPKPNETIQSYLARAVEEGKQRGDAQLIMQARTVQRWLALGGYGGAVPDNGGLLSFVAGQNQEAAGQYVLAVISYQNALKSGDDAIPIKLVAEKLDALKSAHPQDFDQAMATVSGSPRYSNHLGVKPANNVPPQGGLGAREAEHLGSTPSKTAPSPKPSASSSD